jgi:hypothetical protein
MKKISMMVGLWTVIGMSLLFFQNCQKGFTSSEQAALTGSSLVDVNGAMNHIDYNESCLSSQSTNYIGCSEYNYDLPDNSCPDGDPTDPVSVIQSNQFCPLGPTVIGRCFAQVNGRSAAIYLYDRSFLYPDPVVAAEFNQKLYDTTKAECLRSGGAWEDF